jgi:hypothetical protein
MMQKLSIESMYGIDALVLASVLMNEDYYEICMNRVWQVDLTCPSSASFAVKWSQMDSWCLREGGRLTETTWCKLSGFFQGVLNAARLPEFNRL